MYNYSRLCQVWTAFEKGVSENYYEPLPDINTIQFQLLSNEVSSAVLKSEFVNINCIYLLFRKNGFWFLTVCLYIHLSFKILLNIYYRII